MICRYDLIFSKSELSFTIFFELRHKLPLLKLKQWKNIPFQFKNKNMKKMNFNNHARHYLICLSKDDDSLSVIFSLSYKKIYTEKKRCLNKLIVGEFVFDSNKYYLSTLLIV